MAPSSSISCFIIVFSFALLAFSIEGRKDLGKYLQYAMHDQTVSGTTSEVINVDVTLPVSLDEKADCDTMDQLEENVEQRTRKYFGTNFEPRPIVSIYDKDGKLKLGEKKSFFNDFEPRINVFYDKYDKLKVGEKKSFSKDFEPRPNVSIYDKDGKLKVEEKMAFSNDFEPRPNVSIYDNDGKVSVEITESRSNDFEPRPNVSAYGADDENNGLKEEENVVNDFKPRPNVSIYHD